MSVSLNRPFSSPQRRTINACLKVFRGTIGAINGIEVSKQKQDSTINPLFPVDLASFVNVDHWNLDGIFVSWNIDKNRIGENAETSPCTEANKFQFTSIPRRPPSKRKRMSLTASFDELIDNPNWLAETKLLMLKRRCTQTTITSRQAITSARNGEKGLREVQEHQEEAKNKERNGNNGQENLEIQPCVPRKKCCIFRAQKTQRVEV